ncbi:MAG TPA: hypothetical protein VIN08_09355 [Ohtaekwangia sp.]|uniref:hypothetical protein n=1 Tax=Ohtaekwangia sp. TaxID=2066019 RepID=UPI002F93C788
MSFIYVTRGSYWFAVILYFVIFSASAQQYTVRVNPVTAGVNIPMSVKRAAQETVMNIFENDSRFTVTEANPSIEVYINIYGFRTKEYQMKDPAPVAGGQLPRMLSMKLTEISWTVRFIETAGNRIISVRNYFQRSDSEITQKEPWDKNPTTDVQNNFSTVISEQVLQAFPIQFTVAKEGERGSALLLTTDVHSRPLIGKKGKIYRAIKQTYNNGEAVRKVNVGEFSVREKLEGAKYSASIEDGKRDILEALKNGEILLAEKGEVEESNISRKSIAVIPFTSGIDTLGIHQQNLAMNMVVESFLENHQYTLLDHSAYSKSSVTDLSQDLDKIRKDKTIAADYLLTGHIYTFGTAYHKNTGSFDVVKNGYYSTMKIGVKLIDLETGAVVKDEFIESNQIDHHMQLPHMTDATSSLQMALNSFVSRVNHMVLKGELLEVIQITEAKSAKAQKILIAGGTARGLASTYAYGITEMIYPKVPFEIVQILEEEVDGKKLQRYERIGEAKVEDVEGPLFAQCKVTKGNEAVYTALQQGAKLLCRALN